jgi:putative nucleotidyltransferase with HDIG domain
MLKLSTACDNDCADSLDVGAIDDHLDRLTGAVDAKDRYTRRHSLRVAVLARTLAIACGLTERQADRIYLAGRLHDVGKIAVPESILHKAGRLTDEEFATMKFHAEIGAEILREIPQFADLVSAVMHHHERFDGRGYPAQLCGHAIPLPARILCLADSLDAMTSHRPYQQSIPLSDALEEIASCAGTHFDPEISEHLLRIPQTQLQTLLAA